MATAYHHFVHLFGSESVGAWKMTPVRTSVNVTDVITEIRRASLFFVQIIPSKDPAWRIKKCVHNCPNWDVQTINYYR